MKLFSRTPRRAARRHLAAATLAGLAGSVLLSTTGLATAPAAKAADPTCLTGTLKYTFASAEAKTTVTQPARGLTWELWGATGSGSVAKLSTGTTSSTGAYNACSASASLGSAYVRFVAGRTGAWKVVNKESNGTTYTAQTATQTNVSGSKALGTTTVTDSRAGAFKIADVVSDFYAVRDSGTACWTRLQSSGCEQLTYVWTSTRTNGGYFDLDGTNFVILAKDDAKSAHIIVHEAGHWFQWALYSGWFPPSDCPSTHYVDKASAVSCAWTEGLANAVAGWVLGDKRYVRADGSVVPYVPAGGGYYSGGDKTEGNVAAALIDLWRLDGPNGTWGVNLDLTIKYGSDHFKEYFLTNRPRASLPVDGAARDIIESHGIFY
ncbi:hypothetical protein [Nocardioides sp. LML1-1-1.1]|uniref:hypothetical protein n=1 Tax=Nocardioides sp. LML1-1-1.1 TaxID=3135248 RepID=UPI003421C5BC